jgi:uncharacterized protein YndB with AHSA1/START domain
MAMSTSRRAEVTLPSDSQVLITREFDAPARRVYEAWTTPELVRRWWHARRGEVTSVEIDLRVGGAWRWVMVTPDGFEVAFHGTYRELVPGERIVCTEVYEGAPDAASLNTITFTESGGRTMLALLIEHADRANRDMHIESGMEDGLRDALDLLEEVAISLR